MEGIAKVDPGGFSRKYLRVCVGFLVKAASGGSVDSLNAFRNSKYGNKGARSRNSDDSGSKEGGTLSSFFSSIFSPRGASSSSKNSSESSVEGGDGGGGGGGRKSKTKFTFDDADVNKDRGYRSYDNNNSFTTHFDLDAPRPQRYSSKKSSNDQPTTKVDKIDEKLAKEMLRPASFIALGGVALALVGVNPDEHSTTTRSR